MPVQLLGHRQNDLTEFIRFRTREQAGEPVETVDELVKVADDLSVIGWYRYSFSGGILKTAFDSLPSFSLSVAQTNETSECSFCRRNWAGKVAVTCLIFSSSTGSN